MSDRRVNRIPRYPDWEDGGSQTTGSYGNSRIEVKSLLSVPPPTLHDISVRRLYGYSVSELPAGAPSLSSAAASLSPLHLRQVNFTPTQWQPPSSYLFSKSRWSKNSLRFLQLSPGRLDPHIKLLCRVDILGGQSALDLDKSRREWSSKPYQIT